MLLTPELCLITVPHTGTMFVRDLLVSHGWHDVALNGRPNPTPTLFQGHCEKLSQVSMALDLWKRMPIIMPMRHPYRVEESWKRRGKDLGRMYEAYANMLNLLADKVAAWVPVDGSPLIKAVNGAKLCGVVGKMLAIDWSNIVNAEQGTHDLPLHMCNPSGLILDVRREPVFTQFYGDYQEEWDAITDRRARLARLGASPGEGHQPDADRAGADAP